MKKITLVLALLAVASFGFGQAVEATVDGDASLTWGVDLESQATGFQNAASATISFDLVSSASEELTGDAVYGSIKLADFAATVNETDGLTVTAPSVTASLILTDTISVAIYGAPGFSLDNAAGFANIAGDDGRNELAGAVSGTTGGFSVMIDFGLGTATVKAASHGDWDAAGAVDQEFDWVDDDDDITTAPVWQETVAAAAATSNTDNAYSAGLDVTLDPMDMLSVGLGVVYGDFAAADLGATVTLSLTPIDMLGVWANLDAALPNGGGTFDFDTSFGVDVTLDIATLNVYGYYGADDLDVGIDAALLAVENLTLTAAFDLYTLLTTSTWEAQVGLAYDLGGIKPYATVDLDSANVTGINAGVELTGQVPNTTFMIDWDTDDIATDTGDVEASVKIAF